MTAEVRSVAAKVSWENQATKTFHSIVKKDGNVLEAVRVVDGAPTVENTFVNLPENMSSEDKRNLFWKMQRGNRCTSIAYQLLSTCVSLNNRGVKLVHNDVAVKNFFMMNAGFDVSDLEDIKLRATDVKTGQKFEIGLYSTEANKRVLLTLPRSVCKLIDLQPPSYDDNSRCKKVAEYLNSDPDQIVNHWWCCFVLENKTMIQVDLCGPGYNLYQYESVGEAEVPVYIVSSPELFVQDFDPRSAHDLSHKLFMTRGCSDSSGLIASLPPGFRPFQTIEKMVLDITPTDQVLKRNDITKFDPLPNEDDVVNSFILRAIQDNCNSTLSVRVNGIKSRPELNGREFRAVSVNKKGRIIVELSNEQTNQKGECVTMAPGKLSFVVQRRLKQWLTLKEMKTAIKRMIAKDKAKLVFDPQDVVVIEGLQNAVKLNDQRGVLIEPANPALSRWVVELELTKERKSIATKNLRLVTKHVPTKDEVSLRKKIEHILSRDPAGRKFYNRVFTTMNVGFTNVTDPEILPVFKRLVKLKIGEVILRNPAQQRHWEVIVKLTKNRAFGGFRELIQRLRTGIDPEEFKKELEKNPAYKTMYDICLNHGIVKFRNAGR